MIPAGSRARESLRSTGLPLCRTFICNCLSYWRAHSRNDTLVAVQWACKVKISLNLIVSTTIHLSNHSRTKGRQSPRFSLMSLVIYSWKLDKADAASPATTQNHKRVSHPTFTTHSWVSPGMNERPGEPSLFKTQLRKQPLTEWTRWLELRSFKRFQQEKRIGKGK